MIRKPMRSRTGGPEAFACTPCLKRVTTTVMVAMSMVEATSMVAVECK